MQIKPKLDERHEYSVRLVWTGARQGATTSYQAYSREFEYCSGGKAFQRGSADPHFRGDPALYNPEEQLVAALSSCHMLSYLALCARGGISVLSYEDDAHGIMSVKDGKLRFTSVILRPRVHVSAGTDLEKARALHHEAHDECYVASSVNFPVENEPEITIASA
jgi:organic hydroperoxide reductase OsmC/OhrA